MKHFCSKYLFLFALFFSYSLQAQSNTSESTIEKRETPNFDGRESPPSSTGENLLWIPRVAFFPLYVLTEYGFRVPLRWVGRTAELNNLPVLITDFFKFGEDNKYALYPSLLVDFGFRASIGFRFRWRNFLTENNQLKIRMASGGTDYGVIEVTDEWKVSEHGTVKFSGEIGKRPDYIFHAMGPMSSKEDRYRYTVVKKQFGTGMMRETILGPTISLNNFFRSVQFSNSDCCSDPGLESGVLLGTFPLPARYDGGYTSLSQRLGVNWGSRGSRPSNRVGGMVDSFLQHSYDFSGGGWWGYGGALTGFFDLTGRSRVISMKVETELSSPHGDRSVPFNELPALGGDRMPGFLDRRFIGESAFAATFEYHWPVLYPLDGVIHFALGNVFGPNLKGLQWGWLRKSIGIGVDATGEKSSPFGILFAMGSKPFDLGGDFDEVRFSIKIGGGI